MSNSRKRKPRKRLTIEVEPQEEWVLRELRVEAAWEGISMRLAVLNAIEDWVKRIRRARNDGDDA